jgi:hypothetical protein
MPARPSRVAPDLPPRGDRCALSALRQAQRPPAPPASMTPVAVARHRTTGRARDQQSAPRLARWIRRRALLGALRRRRRSLSAVVRRRGVWRRSEEVQDEPGVALAVNALGWSDVSERGYEESKGAEAREGRANRDRYARAQDHAQHGDRHAKENHQPHGLPRWDGGHLPTSDVANPGHDNGRRHAAFTAPAVPNKPRCRNSSEGAGSRRAIRPLETAGYVERGWPAPFSRERGLLPARAGG